MDDETFRLPIVRPLVAVADRVLEVSRPVRAAVATLFVFVVAFDVQFVVGLVAGAAFQGPSTSMRYFSVSSVPECCCSMAMHWTDEISHSPREGSPEPAGGSASCRIARHDLEFSTSRPSRQTLRFWVLCRVKRQASCC